MSDLSKIGTPSTLTCPECGGSLWEIADAPPLRYRCHTGHAYTAGSLDSAQAGAVDHALAAALRALRERELLLLRLATVADAAGDRAQAEAGRLQAARVREQALEMERMAKTPSPGNTPQATAST